MSSVWRSSEADGSAEAAVNEVSAVGLRVASAAAEVELDEREVVYWQSPVIRLHGQRRQQRLAELRVLSGGGRLRFDFAEVREQSHLWRWVILAVIKRDVDAIHL